jgi:hypothetical protein
MNASMTRRGVLSGAALIAAGTALPRLLRPRADRVGHVVVDARLDDSPVFAAGFAAARVHTVGAVDDLCNYWYTRLRREVLAGGGDIAGLTTWMDYVVMRGCAAEIGYCRSHYAERGSPGRRTFTWVFSPRSS